MRWPSGAAEAQLNTQGGGWERTISIYRTDHLYVNVPGDVSYTFFGYTGGHSA